MTNSNRSNFNNMSQEQLQNWSSSFLSEAERDNYVNHNLEIARHYRRESANLPSGSRQGFSLEQNAIEMAIARHGLKARVNDEEEEEEEEPPVSRPRLSAGYQHYLALTYIFSDSYQNARNHNEQDMDLNETAMKKTIDSLGLRGNY